MGLTRACVGVVGFAFARVHSRARRCRQGSPVFTRGRVRFAGFIQVRVGALGRAYWSPGLFRFAWVQPGAPTGRRVNSCSLRFSQARVVVARFIVVRLGSLGLADSSPSKGSPGYFGITWIHSCSHRWRRFYSGSRGLTRTNVKGRRVYSGSHGLTLERVGVAVFNLVRLCSLNAPSYRRVYSGSCGFTRAHIEGA